MDSIAEEEKLIYEELWKGTYHKSKCADPLIRYVSGHIEPWMKVLEIGAGDCTTMNGLIDMGYDITGVDLVKMGNGVITATAWDLPFRDDKYDVTYSTDVFEHFPTVKVDAAIRECMRVTSKKLIHVIACWECVSGLHVLHKTVKNITWWRNKFDELNTKKLELVIIDRDDFLKE